MTSRSDSVSAETVSEKMLPPDLWMVVIHANYTGSWVVETKEKAVEIAKHESGTRRHQVGIYKCHFAAVALPQESELSNDL